MHIHITRAATLAIKCRDPRNYFIGAIGIRRDGAIVHAVNGPAKQKTPSSHAEARLVRKLDRGATVYVVRVRRTGSLGMAMPCGSCLRLLRKRGVARVVYTDEDGGIRYMRL